MLRRLLFVLAIELVLLHVWHVLVHGARAVLSWYGARGASADAAIEALRALR
jgi:hypothetical protein